MGEKVWAKEMKKLAHNSCEPAKAVCELPDLWTRSLLSTSKFADACCISIFDKDEINICDDTDAKITVSRGSILRGWQDPTAKGL